VIRRGNTAQEQSRLAENCAKRRVAELLRYHGKLLRAPFSMIVVGSLQRGWVPSVAAGLGL
jgi:hypothetical protein